ncbi:neuroblast differentiation-associated protein AHNAK [Austrofundulus limnaeus]|uniref:Neuroblast differentiation-associated protein AHNAK n=1 Tax=Austrofundulus limnaeus TaxID=52670 RepID=A0A2I4D7Z1_AUSLI|nr:PREDICTED: neuroblast differentiation-associated protein AHNAK-like [Austrofundulus limnaeus]
MEINTSTSQIMPTHRRGRSLSEALTLDQSEEGGLFISNINSSSQRQDLKEGDELLGATINFDHLSKDEVLKVLKLMEPYDDKIQVFTRKNLNRSLDNLNQYDRTPGAMLNDSYNKLYNAKIKKFMKSSSSGEDAGSANGETTVPASSKVSLKHDIGLPRLGVDFGLLKSKTLVQDANVDSNSKVKDLMDGSNLNLPPVGLGTLSNSLVPRLKPDARNPQLNAPDCDLSGTLPDDQNVRVVPGKYLSDTEKASYDLTVANLDLSKERLTGSASNVSVPKADIKRPQMDLEKVDFNVSQHDITETDFDMPSGDINVSLQKPKTGHKFDHLNMGAPTGSFTLPRLGVNGRNEDEIDLSLKRPQFKGGISASDASLFKTNMKEKDLNTDAPSVQIKGRSGKYKAPKFTMPKFDLPNIQVPDFSEDLDLPGTDLTVPSRNLEFSSSTKRVQMSQDLSMKTPQIKGEMNTTDRDLPNIKMKNPKSDVNTPDVNIGSPKTKLKLAKMKMPTIGSPNMNGPEIDGNINAPDIDVKAPNVNFKGPKTDLDMDLPDLSGKFKKPNLNLPDLGLSGPKLDGPNLDLKSQDIDISAPKLRGGINAPDINMPNFDLNAPKLDLNRPKVNLDMPSGKLKMPELEGPDWDVNAPSGKLKMPKMNFSGTLPKGPDLGLNTDLKTPDFNLKNPKIKGEMNTPDLDMPNIKMKNPKLNVNSPDVNFGSPKAKFKRPDINMPGLKGPDGPDNDFDLPNVNIKNSRTGFEIHDADIGSTSRKTKMPTLKLPNVGFSGPTLDGSPDLKASLPKGPNLKLNSDLNSPDLNLKLPNNKGKLDSPNMSLPNMNLKTSKNSFEVPDVDFGTQSGKMKMPHMNIPDLGFSGPMLDSPNPSLSSPKLNAKLPKGPHLKINSEVNAPDQNVRAPKTKGGLTFPKLGTPDLNIDDPSVKLKGPSSKTHKPFLTNMSIKNPDLDIDEDVSLSYTNEKSSGTKVRASYPAVDDTLHQYFNFNRSDLNIDDFTEKDHVLRARGSKLDFQAPFIYTEGMPTSGVDVHMRDARKAKEIPISGKESFAYSRDLSQNSQRNVPESSEGYYITVFPTQAQNQKTVNRKFNTLGGLDFHTDNLDLDVPDKNDLKGSNFFFSNLV